MDETVLDHRGLRVHPHNLVALRLVAGDGVKTLGDQLLDQLGPRGLVLDQHDTRAEPLVLPPHRLLQLGIFQAPPQHVEQIEVLAGNAQLVQTLKSLSSVALRAVSQLCTIHPEEHLPEDLLLAGGLLVERPAGRRGRPRVGRLR
jgi:hypothetical protein